MSENLESIPAALNRSDAIAAQVELELTHLLYRSAGFGLFSNIVLSLLLATGIWSFYPHSEIVGWTAALFVISAVRIAMALVFLKRPPTGDVHYRWRYAFLVGSNPEASRFSGIPAVRVKILAFVLASMMAGLVGVLLTSRLGGPPGGAVGYEMIAIECAMIGGASLSGGAGSIGGAVLGSFLISTLAMGLTMMGANQISLPTLLNGLILLVVVYLDQKQNWK